MFPNISVAHANMLNKIPSQIIENVSWPHPVICVSDFLNNLLTGVLLEVIYRWFPIEEWVIVKIPKNIHDLSGRIVSETIDN